jgi:hypothetical protein
LPQTKNHEDPYEPEDNNFFSDGERFSTQHKKKGQVLIGPMGSPKHKVLKNVGSNQIMPLTVVAMGNCSSNQSDPHINNLTLRQQIFSNGLTDNSNHIRVSDMQN